MRFVIAMMQHETNTFSPLETPFQSFGGPTGFPYPPQGEEAISAYKSSGFAIDAFIDLAEEADIDFVVPIAANAEPSGPVDDDAFDRIAECICDAVAAGCDAVLLDLHGAMVVQSHDDGEGELLKRIRNVNPVVPIAVALDMHTNLTRDIVDNATIITGYCTNPHVDMYETGMRAGRTLLRTLKGEINPVISWGTRPMLTHMLNQAPTKQPLKDIMSQAVTAEQNGAVINASVFSGFPLSDIPHACFGAVVVTDGDRASGQVLVDSILNLAWQRREQFIFEAEPYQESITRALEISEGSVVLADHGDNTWAGGMADDMTVLTEMINRGMKNIAAGPIWDPQSVNDAIKAGIGATVTLEIGGKSDVPSMNLKGQPLKVSGQVRAITNGIFTITGPMMKGFKAHIGHSVVLDTGAMEILISSERSEGYDLVHFTHAGIDLSNKKYIYLKSRQHFRSAYEPFSEHIIMVAGPGVCSSDYGIFPFKKLNRPIYPLDKGMELSKKN